ncbi:MAG: transposase [Actinoallomurus sp.]
MDDAVMTGRVTRQVRTSPSAAYDLEYHVVWCPKYRRPVLGGRAKTRLEEPSALKPTNTEAGAALHRDAVFARP